jgi:calcium-dependent protein kinase
MVFREAEMLKSMHHKNIVKILNCFTLSNMQVVFIMEYCGGGELLEYVVNRGKLVEQEAQFFFR